MSYNMSSIETFTEVAKEKWPFYFVNAKRISKKEWDKMKRQEAGLPEPTKFEIEVTANAQYAIFESYVFILEKPMLFYVVEEAFYKEKSSIRIYNLVSDYNESSGRKALYTIDFKSGMYLIFLSSNEEGKVSEIHVDVYFSFDEFTSSLSNYWTEINAETTFSVRNIIEITKLANIIATQ